MDSGLSDPLPPHVVFYPFPIQSHVNTTMSLAELLCLAGFRITFVISEHGHSRLAQYTDTLRRLSASYREEFVFKVVPDGLDPDAPRSDDNLWKIYDNYQKDAGSLFRELNGASPVTCIIADGLMTFSIDVAEELGIPLIVFRLIGPQCFWTYFNVPQMIETGDLPIKGEEDMEAFIRCSDLPSFCRVADPLDPFLQYIIAETLQTKRAQALVFNTFDQLDRTVLEHVRKHFPNVYTVGPLHKHLKLRLAQVSGAQSQVQFNSFWQVDRSCIAWLNKQPPRSVIYVSFGSLTRMTREQLMGFWHGLVNSGQRFLWVIRPDLVAGHEQGSEPIELRKATEERGYMVGWAPQEEVLEHSAVGAFLTHSGWNSTLESLVAGVPMLCWPYYADQQLNSRVVSEAWKAGLDMKDICDREVMQKMVNDLMVDRKEEFLSSTGKISKAAKDAVTEGGSSWESLDCLIEDIKAMRACSYRCLQ
ncbi:hypothetical protein MLD38_011137 [Melastoma candidum]|uniref:Uncharacterized protein n=1 Tax=Melastoma candidum TaxID=119954 RepID=A0ACB9R262_9MYRT|nr:hypothetical protein MLD38_011137 [Melastoma candidum]